MNITSSYSTAPVANPIVDIPNPFTLVPWCINNRYACLSKVLNSRSLEIAANIRWCYDDPLSCVDSAMKSLTFSVPNYALSTAGNTAWWLGKQTVDLSDMAIRKGCSYANFDEIDIKGAASPLYTRAAALTTALAQSSLFKCAPIVGPGALLAFASHKAAENSASALKYLKMLCSGKRVWTQVYQAPVTHWNLSGPKEIPFYSTQRYTNIQLLRNIVVETAFTAAWGYLAYQTGQGITDALVNEGITAEYAQNLIKMISTTAVVAPKLLNVLSNIFKILPEQEKGPEYAERFTYADPRMIGKMSSRNLSLKEVLALLEEYSQTQEDEEEDAASAVA